MHVRIEDLGFVASTPGACQETHEVHDELKARWIGAEEEMRRIAPTPTSHRRPRQGRGEVPAGIVPRHLQGYHEGEDGEADGAACHGRGW